MELKGSKTEVNLRNAFIGEAMARCRYMYYAEKAREEGREDVAAVYGKHLQEMSRNMQKYGLKTFMVYQAQKKI